MSAIQNLLTEHLDVWTAADTGPKSGRGRSAANAAKVYGISKLRELILELAVRGKLVPQNASDEPASELLKRIQAEKAKLIAKGQVKKDKPLPPITGEEKQFWLPAGWEWARLNDFVLSIISGGTPSKNNSQFWGGNIPWASVKDLNVEKFLKETQDHITKEGLDDGSKLANKGDLLICTRMGLGKIAVAAVDVAINQDLKALKITSLLDVDYFISFYRTLKIAGSGMTVAGIKQDELLSYCVPTPPLAEQIRIVAKVDELMALCDQLEAEHNNASAAHEKLVSELLATLTQSPVRGEPVPQGDYLRGIEPRPSMDSTSSPSGRTEFEENWQRIAAHFDTLFTTETSIDALKQTLLQLAVMGKLVPQNPNDEPASELLKRIQAEKAKLIAEGKIKKDKPLAPITDEEKLFDLPQGWEWSRFGNISAIKGELVRPEDHQDSRQIAPDCIEKGTGRITEDRTVKESGVKGPNSRFYAGQIVYSKIRPSLSKAVLVDFDGLCSADMYPIDAFVDSEFLLKQILSEPFLEQVRIAENRIKMPKLNQESLTAFVLPTPPLAEQHRIVAKVDELMALCDQLKSRLSEASQLQQKLADVLVENAVAAKAQPENAEQSDSQMDQTTARTLLATEVVHQLNTETRMGRVKLQKVVNLAEYIACLEEIASEPERKAAGPHDPHFMKQVLHGMKDRQWYEEQPADDGKSYRYRPMAQAGQHRTAYEALWSPEQRRKISGLIELMRPWKTEQCERVATLYSAWNDLLIEGNDATEAAILKEVLKRWNDSKLKFSEAEWQAELGAMKKHALLIPTGFGQRTTGGTQTLPFLD